MDALTIGLTVGAVLVGYVLGVWHMRRALRDALRARGAATVHDLTEVMQERWRRQA
jgi:hypothetical protein